MDIMIQKLKFPAFLKHAACIHVATECTTSHNPTSPLKEFVGALDGLVVQIREPREVSDLSIYFNRKRYYGLPVQATACADYSFSFISIKCAGRMNDTVAFGISSLGRWLAENNLEEGF